MLKHLILGTVAAASIALGTGSALASSHAPSETRPAVQACHLTKTGAYRCTVYHAPKTPRHRAPRKH